MCRKRKAWRVFRSSWFNISLWGGLSEENARRAKGNDAIANGRCYFQTAIAAKWQQEGRARAEISDLRPLVASQLHFTRDRLLLLERPHELCTKVPNNLHAEHTFRLETPASFSLVDPRLGASLTLQLDYCYFYRTILTISTVFLSLTHICLILYCMTSFFPH